MRPASGNGEHQQAQEDSSERIEFGFTHEELSRYLPSALEPFKHHLDGVCIAIEVGGGRIRMELEPQHSRRIALLELPVTPIVFSFEAVTDAERQHFFHRLRLALQRGGG